MTSETNASVTPPIPVVPPAAGVPITNPLTCTGTPHGGKRAASGARSTTSPIPAEGVGIGIGPTVVVGKRGFVSVGRSKR